MPKPSLTFEEVEGAVDLSNPSGGRLGTEDEVASGELSDGRRSVSTALDVEVSKVGTGAEIERIEAGNEPLGGRVVEIRPGDQQGARFADRRLEAGDYPRRPVGGECSIRVHARDAAVHPIVTGKDLHVGEAIVGCDTSTVGDDTGRVGSRGIDIDGIGRTGGSDPIVHLIHFETDAHGTVSEVHQIVSRTKLEIDVRDPLVLHREVLGIVGDQLRFYILEDTVDSLLHSPARLELKLVVPGLEFEAHGLGVGIILRGRAGVLFPVDAKGGLAEAVDGSIDGGCESLELQFAEAIAVLGALGTTCAKREERERNDAECEY